MKVPEFYTPQEKLQESNESPAKEKWVRQASDLLKKFWFASLVVALPSLAEAKEPVKFEDIWKTLTSGRVGTTIGSTITERSGSSDQDKAYLRAYRSYNARLDSFLNWSQ